jgi:hypothetical protein
VEALPSGRVLIETPYENSLDARYVSKPVFESMVVDDMETDRAWTVFGIGKMARVCKVVV